MANKESKKIVEIVFESDSEDEVEIVFESDGDSESDVEEKEVKEEFEEPNEFGVKMLKGFSIYEHQSDAIKWIQHREENPRLGIKGGILALTMGLGKCHDPDTPILLWNGDIKKAKDIVAGDLLIGDDSTPRTVLSTCTGREMMYEVIQDNGDSYRVNESHILTLCYPDHKTYKWNDKKCMYILTWIDVFIRQRVFSAYEYGSRDIALRALLNFRSKIPDSSIIDIDLVDYIKLHSGIKSTLMGFKVGVDFPEQKVNVDPIELGRYLGRQGDIKLSEDIRDFVISNGISKRIPKCCLVNSRDFRIKLLQGILQKENVESKVKHMVVHEDDGFVDDLLYLCRSLGIRCEKTLLVKHGLWQVEIWGLEYIKDTTVPVLCSIKVKRLNVGEYCGFVLDGNHRYLLGDFTVTHNTLTATTNCMTEIHTPKVDYKKVALSDIKENTKTHEFPNLVVCSKTVAYEWKRDINKFFGESCPFLYFHRSALKNFDLMTYDSIKNYKIVITTYETVMGIAKKHKVMDKQMILDQSGRRSGIENSRCPTPSTIKNAKGGMLLFSIPWHRIIADESHRFVNPKSMTFYSMMCLHGKYKLCLSGTPLKNFSSDIYSQLRFCGYDQTLISSQFNYDIYNRNKLYEFILCKDYKDAGIVLPDIKENTINIELDGREKEIYDYYHGATKKIYNGFLVGSHNFSNVLTLFLRLRQICVSPYTILAESSRGYKGCKENEESEYTISQKILDEMTDGLAAWVKDKTGTAGINSAKMKALIDIITNIPNGEKTLVFTSFKKVIDVAVLAIKTFLPNKNFLILDGDVTGDEREETLDMFKNKSLGYDVLFISYKVGSEGLNLVEANNIVMCENWWTPVVQQQARSRAYRIGQKNIVNVWSIIVKNSIEEKIDEICSQKLRLIDDFLISKKKFSAKLDAATLGRIIR